jgi:hypothetical protein
MEDVKWNATTELPKIPKSPALKVIDKITAAVMSYQYSAIPPPFQELSNLESVTFIMIQTRRNQNFSVQ